MAAKMRAKMTLQEITVNAWSDKLKFSCVYGGSTNAEDNTFARASPCGDLTLQVDNPELRGKFTPGETYYVDFTPVPATLA